MKPRVRRHLSFAVFLIFGVIGPVSVLMESKLDPVSWKFVTIQTITCGGIAASIVYFYNIRWLVWLMIVFWSGVLIMNAGGINFVYNEDGFQVHLGQSTGVIDAHIGGRLHSTTLNESQIKEMYAQRAVLGIFAIALLAVGYSRFLFVIRGEIRERTRLLTEVTIAQKLQESLLPTGGLEAGWCSVSGITVPTAEVGGDYYDHIKLSDTRIAVVIADVSGHGVGSGIVSAMLKSALYGQIRRDPDPAIVLKNLNETLVSVIPKNMFVTCAYALVDNEAKRVILATAGHPPVFLRRAEDQQIVTLKTESMALGMKKDSSYDELSLPLAAGDLYLLYTDGVIEASNAKGEEFGLERLKTVLLEDKITDFTGSTVDRVRRFSGTDTFRDDVTVVGIELR